MEFDLKKVIVVDNAVNKEYQDELQNLLLGNNFPWYYVQDITDSSKTNSQKRAALCHYFINETEVISNYFKFIENIIVSGAENIKLKGNVRVLLARSFLQFPLNKKTSCLDTPHRDLTRNHLVFLYYVTDNEAETIIYNNTKLSKKMVELKKIKPKKGRLVIFNGKYYHTARQPTKGVRCVINIDIC
tara:strand:+ start:2361 stop:2921 length:561 start_codon:yes stop_codon:yes gene_type:complete